MPVFSTPVRSLTRRLRDERTAIFVAIATGWLLSTSVRNVYPVLLPFLRVEYGLSLSMAGLLLSVLTVSYALGQVPGGMMADRFGEGVTMVVSMVVAGVSIALIVIAGSTPVLFVGTAFLGGAIGLFGVVRLTALADVFPGQVGTVHGLLGAVGDLGNTVLPPLAGILAAVAVWQLGFGFLLPIIVVATVALWVYVPSRTSPPSGTSDDRSVERVRRVVTVLRSPALSLGLLLMVLHMVIMMAFIGFFPTYLIESKGLSAFAASGLFAVFFAMGVVVKPIAGNTYDRFGIRRSLLLIVGLAVIGFSLLPFVGDVLSLLAVTILVGIHKGKGTIGLAYLTMSLPADVKNTGLGTLRSIMFSLGALSQLVFGVIADRGFFDEAFALLAVLTAISLLIALRLPPLDRSLG